MFKVSPTLRSALAAWLKETRKRKARSTLVVTYGLCTWVDNTAGRAAYVELNDLFKEHFRRDSWSCPFDAAGIRYFAERDCSVNPARIAFVEFVLAMNPVCE